VLSITIYRQLSGLVSQVHVLLARVEADAPADEVALRVAAIRQVLDDLQENGRPARGRERRADRRFQFSRPPSALAPALSFLLFGNATAHRPSRTQPRRPRTSSTSSISAFACCRHGAPSC